MTSSTDAHPLIANYDADNYDYRTHWKNRAYEQWAESFALERLLVRMKQARWLIDFGGGFGRNFVHYSQRAEHVVLVDYSMGNLKHAASMYTEEAERGHLFLVRADLYHVPFVDRAFDSGFIVRVLHHLTAVDDALQEMGRVVSQQWLLDIPIKHHVFARLSALLHGELRELSTAEPKMLGQDDTPFASYQLKHIRQLLSENGWDSSVIASVNNFRRWDQRLPKSMIVLLKPVIYGLEMILQRVGKGWWGPSQFVWATRREPGPAQELSSPQPSALSGQPWAMLAPKMWCPVCHQPLQWSLNEAHCEQCSRIYPKKEHVWDFVPQ